METIRLDLLNIGYAYIVFLLAYVANILFSLYYNVKINGEDFNKYTLFTSLKKAVVFLVATIALVIAVDIAILYFSIYVPELSETIKDTLTVFMVTSTIGRAAIKYIFEAYNTFVHVLSEKTLEITNAMDKKG